MPHLKTANVLIVSVASVVLLVTVVILGIRGNDHADKSRENRERICVDAGYQWVKDDCLYPPKGRQ